VDTEKVLGSYASLIIQPILKIVSFNHIELGGVDSWHFRYAQYKGIKPLRAARAFSAFAAASAAAGWSSRPPTLLLLLLLARSPNSTSTTTTTHTHKRAPTRGM
jgi:hypothetical protein